MANRKYCCDPLKIHKSLQKKDLRNVSTQLLQKFSSLFTKDDKLCSVCRKKLSEFSMKQNTLEVPITLASDQELSDMPSQKKDSDVVEKEVEVDLLNQSLSLIGESPFDKRKAKRYPTYAPEKRSKVEESVKRKLDLVTGSSSEKQDVLQRCNVNCMPEVIQSLKEKYQQSSRTDQIKILTIFATSMSVRKLMSEFDCSQRMAVQAHHILKEKGMLASPNPKAGKMLSEEVKSLVLDYYRSDDMSRVLPGKKDCLVVRIEGEKRALQKRLVLSNLKELHRSFKIRYPEVKVSFSKFAMLRPSECVLAGGSGTHSVCVCTIHQNLKLMMVGSKMSNLTDLPSYHHAIASVVCNPARPECYMRLCQYCPPIDQLKTKLLTCYEQESVDKIEFKQWTSTDRSELVTMILSLDDFMDKFCDCVEILVRHDFVAKSQAQYLETVKNNIVDGEYVVIGDFSENFSFVIQDAAQGYHWNTAQATIHPWVFYYNKDGKLCHSSYTIISECNIHDNVSVHLFQRMLIEYLKSVFRMVKKIHYFSDGCAAQYKNCKSFQNLCWHKEEYGVDAEWHFFATSHGKGPSDGVGGTIKREATKESLRRPYDKQIITPKDLFAFAETLGNMKFGYATQREYDQELEILKNRPATKTIAGTQKLHSFIPVSKEALQVRPFSLCETFRLESVTKNISRPIFSGKLAGYVTVMYDGHWWLACITKAFPESREISVKFLHPHGPSPSFYFPEIEDSCTMDMYDILVSVEPKTATGRSYTISRKECDATTKVMALHK